MMTSTLTKTQLVILSSTSIAIPTLVPTSETFTSSKGVTFNDSRLNRDFNNKTYTFNYQGDIKDYDKIIKKLLSDYISETFLYEVVQYSGENSYYVNFYDSSKSTEENFDISDELNDLTLKKSLPFIFSVGI